jgi:hypothetical protein
MFQLYTGKIENIYDDVETEDKNIIENSNEENSEILKRRKSNFNVFNFFFKFFFLNFKF